MYTWYQNLRNALRATATDLHPKFQQVTRNGIILIIVNQLASTYRDHTSSSNDWYCIHFSNNLYHSMKLKLSCCLLLRQIVNYGHKSLVPMVTVIQEFYCMGYSAKNKLPVAWSDEKLYGATLRTQTSNLPHSMTMSKESHYITKPPHWSSW